MAGMVGVESAQKLGDASETRVPSSTQAERGTGPSGQSTQARLRKTGYCTRKTSWAYPFNLRVFADLVLRKLLVEPGNLAFTIEQFNPWRMHECMAPTL